VVRHKSSFKDIFFYLTVGAATAATSKYCIMTRSKEKRRKYENYDTKRVQKL